MHSRNLRRITVEPSRRSRDPHSGALGVGVGSMMRHRTITGFAAVALLVAAATAAIMRSHSPGTDGIVVSAGTTLLKDLTVDANKLPTADFDVRWSARSDPTTDAAETQAR